MLTPLLALSALLAAAPAAHALRMGTCESDVEFVCGNLAVPLDHSGRVGGKLSLQVAAQRSYPRRAGLMVALSGGPGQSSVTSAGAFADALQPVLHRYRLAVIDQRGTGRGALLCPRFQRLGTLDPYSPQAVLDCAQRVGPRRSFYATRDTVQDIEAMRRAFGVRKIALMGISYGTWVAQEYARRYPGRVDRLILDSVVGPEPNDPFFLDSYRQMPRVLSEQCAKDRCRGATKHPVADLGAVARRLGRGQLRGVIYDSAGVARRSSLKSEEQLAYLVTSGDGNPFLQARLPGALAAAAAGDFQPLLRTRRLANGSPASASDFSSALNMVTGCLDAQLPFPLSAPAAERPALVKAALDAVPPSDYDPWSATAVLRSAFADDCLMFPRQVAVRRSTAPLPDVPAMILSGRLDVRTPAENGRQAAAQLPRARVIEVPGNGHDQVDTDVSGCVATALKRWIDRRRLGNPCKGISNQVQVFPRPPRSVSGLEPSSQIPGQRGKVVRAAIETASEVRFAAFEATFAGLDPHGGGLRGGSYSATDPFEGVVTLRRYEYVPGVRLSGRLQLGPARVMGTVRVEGLLSGRLEIDTRTGATGVLGGKRVRFRRSRAGAASAGFRVPLIPRALRDRAALERRLAALGQR